MNANSIQVLIPYKYAGTWVFDDPSTGLVKEAFVSGIPEMIEKITKDIHNPEKGFRLLFSPNPFPGHQIHVQKVRQEYGGNWYKDVATGHEGWLCPALFKYFEKAPENIYAKAEAI